MRPFIMNDISALPTYEADLAYLQQSIRSIPDYPKTGILFRDVTSLCEDKKAFNLTIDMLYEIYKDSAIDKIVAAEARGFVFGAALANKLNCGFVMVRKPGKLPREVIEEHYDLEYGQNTLQIHRDSIKQGERILIIDDLLATAGTVSAMIKLVRRLGGEIVSTGFVIELFDLGGADKIRNEYHVDCRTLVRFPGH